MARMSIDDSLGRDTNLEHLAFLCGWSVREAAGCLVIDVWPLCYDRVTPNLPPSAIEMAASRRWVAPPKHEGGFVAALMKSGLARPATRKDAVYVWVKEDGSVQHLAWKDPEWRDRVYIVGAPERIAYLLKKSESGKSGGRKSAESRKNKSKQSPSTASSSASGSASSIGSRPANPTVTVTSSPTSSSPDSDPRDCAVPPAAAQPDSAELSALKAKVDDQAAKARVARGTQLPDGWVPDRGEANLAAEAESKARGVDLRLELVKMRDWAKGKGATGKDWDARWRNWIRNARAAQTKQQPTGGVSQALLDMAMGDS